MSRSKNEKSTKFGRNHCTSGTIFGRILPFVPNLVPGLRLGCIRYGTKKRSQGQFTISQTPAVWVLFISESMVQLSTVQRPESSFYRDPSKTVITRHSSSRAYGDYVSIVYPLSSRMYYNVTVCLRVCMVCAKDSLVLRLR